MDLFTSTFLTIHSVPGHRISKWTGWPPGCSSSLQPTRERLNTARPRKPAPAQSQYKSHFHASAVTMPRKRGQRDSEVSWKQTASEASTSTWNPTSQTVLKEYVKATGSRYTHKLYQFPDRPRNALGDCPNYADSSYSVSALDRSDTSGTDELARMRSASTGAAKIDKKRPNPNHQTLGPIAKAVQAKQKQKQPNVRTLARALRTWLT